MEWIDALLRCWGAWSNRGSRREIRALTGCGPGPISEAGPPARHVYGAPALGEVHVEAVVELLDPTELERVDKAVSELTGDLRLVVREQYLKPAAPQHIKALKIGVSHTVYTTRLSRAKRQIVEVMGKHY